MRFVAARNRGVGKGLLPTLEELGRDMSHCPRRSYHPSQEGSPRGAVA
ncbi:hypothetical protein OK006_8767 [Actinobacteria bacterium OK006]|nr:hypothetical protein OK006_8767 [Actinobacteria bacterium OK006]